MNNRKLLLENVHIPGIDTFEVYRKNGGYRSVEKALKSISDFLDPKPVTAEVQVNQMEEITAEPLVVEKPVPVTSRTMSRKRNQTSYLQ
jgi:hypothetical protein